MIVYKYQAKNNSGVKLKGKMECISEATLSNELRQKGYFIISCKAETHSQATLMFNRASKLELAILCKQLSIIFSCGMNIAEAFRLLSHQSKKISIKKSLSLIKEEIEKGESLGDSFNKFTSVYPVIMISMIQIGEESGSLEKIFLSLSNYFEREDKISRKIMTAMAYPILLAVVTISIVTFLMIKIVPAFAITLSSMGQSLPPLTLLVLNISNFMSKSYIYLILICILCFLLLKKVSKNEKFKVVKDNFVIKNPFFKKIYKCFTELRFTVAMSILLDSGNTVFKSIQYSALCTNNVVIKKQFSQSIDEIMKGRSTVSALAKIEILEPLIISMISIGEETGTLPEMFKKASEIIEDDVNRQLGKLTVLLEPIMIVILSIIVGVIVYAVMLPIMSTMDSIK